MWKTVSPKFSKIMHMTWSENCFLLPPLQALPSTEVDVCNLHYVALWPTKKLDVEREYYVNQETNINPQEIISSTRAKIAKCVTYHL